MDDCECVMEREVVNRNQCGDHFCNDCGIVDSDMKDLGSIFEGILDGSISVDDGARLLSYSEIKLLEELLFDIIGERLKTMENMQ